MKELTHGLFDRLYRFIMEDNLNNSAIIAFVTSTVILAMIGIAINGFFI